MSARYLVRYRIGELVTIIADKKVDEIEGTVMGIMIRTNASIRGLPTSSCDDDNYLAAEEGIQYHIHYHANGIVQGEWVAAYCIRSRDAL